MQLQTPRRCQTGEPLRRFQVGCSDAKCIGGLDLYPYTFTLGPGRQHRQHQLVTVRQAADFAGIPLPVASMTEAVVEQRLNIHERAEYPAVDVREFGRDSAYGFLGFHAKTAIKPPAHAKSVLSARHSPSDCSSPAAMQSGNPGCTRSTRPHRFPRILLAAS